MKLFVCAFALAFAWSALAIDFRFGADGLSIPALNGKIELFLPKAPGWKGAFVAPVENTFDRLPDGVMPYAIREMTGHSWTYGLGSGLMTVHHTDERSLVITNIVTYSEETPLQVECFRIRLARKFLKNGTWRLDGRTGVWPETAMSDVRVASFTLPELEEELTFCFDAPITVRFQDDEKSKTDTYSVWFGNLSPHIVKAGETWSVGYTITSKTPISVSIASKYEIGGGTSWIPVDFYQSVKKGSALDFSEIGFIDGPAGKHGWLKNVGGHFSFEDDLNKKVRFYGLNLCFSVNYPTHEQAEELSERFARMGYNAVRIHHHDGLLGWNKQMRTFDADFMDRLDYFASRLFGKGLYATTDLYVSRRVTWSELGLPSPDGNDIIRHETFKGVIMMTDEGYDNWLCFASDFLNHVNPYTKRAYKDEPALPLLALVNENPLSMGWHELRKFPFVQRLWCERFGTNDCASVREDDKRFAVFSAEVEEKFVRRAKSDLRRIGAKALFTDISCGALNAEYAKVRRENYDFTDMHFYIDHPQFLSDKRWCPPQYVGGTNPFRSANLYPFVMRQNAQTPNLPFTSTEWSFVGPSRYRGAGGIATGAAAALADWGGVWRFAYSHAIEYAVCNFGAVRCFDVASDPVLLLADRMPIMLFLRGDLAPGDEQACRRDPTEGSLTIDTPRTSGGFRERGKIRTSALTAELGDAMGAVWASSLEAVPLTRSRRILMTHVTDVQDEGTTFTDESRSIMLCFGENGLRALDGSAEIMLRHNTPEMCRVYALGLDGRRRGTVQARVSDDGIAFTARVKGADGKACFLYEIVCEEDVVPE